MATTDNAVQYDILFLDELAKNVSDFDKAEIQTLEKSAELGWIQRDRVAETVVAKLAKLDVVSIEGMDFSDGSDMKTVVSSYRNNDKKRGGWSNSFEIRNIGTKTGALRIMAYNKLLKKFHYFFIPRYAYAHLNSVLTITIETGTCHIGEPNFTGIPRGNKFWEFECASLQEMCDMREESLDQWDLKFNKI